MRALIIDDFVDQTKYLSSLIQSSCPDIELTGIAHDVKSGIELVNKQSADILFLDIEMPDGTGFDLLREVDNRDFEVIFTTSHEEFGIQAVKFSAIDYLLKPIDKGELEEAVEKARKKIRTKEKSENIDLLLAKLNDPKDQRIALPTTDGLVIVSLDNIIRIEADGNYTLFHMADGGKLITSKIILYYERLLNGKGFFRVHRSHLINLSHLKEYNKSDGGYVILSDEHPIGISMRRKEAFMKEINEGNSMFIR